MEFVKQNWNKFLIFFISLIVLIVIFTFAIDIKSKALIDDAFTQAVVVFGSAKALNAVISLAQGTEIDLPFLTIAVGEILDPINDLVEQFAFVMLASLTSLGIQKILMNFVTADLYNITLASCLIVLNIWLYLRFRKDDKIRILFFKITIILLFLRFAVPCISLVNDLSYEYFVKPHYNIEQLNENIIKVKEDISKVTNETIQKKDNSFLDKMIEKFDSKYYLEKVNQYQKAVDNSSEYIVSLIIAFIFQTIFLPIVFLFSLYYLIRGLFSIGK
ncbi:hypothetical protein [Arcobacter sp. LA11]|uniref:hypothetical protein n=1 Tax=Arcobacter sp. LA11 TaxID=1898176 RepID=UPI0009346D2D|nr:hypothetical protein [Arcobacter sp. LA11]